MRLCSLPFVVFALTALPGSAQAIDYRLRDISANGVFKAATVINDAGQVTGFSLRDDGSSGYYYSATTGLLRLEAPSTPGGAGAGHPGPRHQCRWPDGRVPRAGPADRQA